MILCHEYLTVDGQKAVDKELFDTTHSEFYDDYSMYNVNIKHNTMTAWLIQYSPILTS